MSVASEIQRIINGKDDVKQYVFDEFGIVIPDSVTIDNYKYYLENSDYLSFYCDEAGTIGWKFEDMGMGEAKTIQYSKNFGSNWTNLTSTSSGASISVSAGDIVWFKGINNQINTNMISYNHFQFSNKVHVYGNVNSITGNNTSVDITSFFRLFYNCSNLYTYKDKKIILPATEIGEYCYNQMFFGCTNMVTAPELPADQLSDYCYQSMFEGCTSLAITPELKASQLASGCYDSMFSGCTQIISAPELSATTLFDYCYQGMFSNCSNLQVAPELPATTLTQACYAAMFSGCSNLKSAPELPALTLAINCYRGMFSGCTSLTTAPELSATTLVTNCYYHMFDNCSSLNYIKALFTTTPSSSYTNNWVNGVAPTGTFVKSVAATWNETGVNGVPTGWAVISY